MGLPVGTIWQVGIESLVSGQRCLNILHYRTTAESTITGIADEAESVAAEMNKVNGVIPKMLACMHTSATIVRVSAQAIRNTRYARQFVEVDEDGSIGTGSVTPNVSAVITKRTTFSGRWAVGSFHLAGIPSSQIVNGLLDSGYKTLVSEIASEILAPLDPTVGGGEYEPILLHPLGQHGGYTALTQADVQDTVRVMRRRTVGLGI